MDFNNFYSKQEHYFSPKHSGGMAEFIEKYSVSACRAVDLGAGEGRNSIYLSKLGFDVIAIEPSTVGANKIKEYSDRNGLGIKVLNTDFIECLDRLQNIGFLVSLTSLEHMEYSYMIEAIKSIKQILNVGGYVYIMVFTEDDPGFKNESENASECSAFIKHYFKKNELKNHFSDFEILHYSEYIKEDNAHGPIHFHGKAKLFAKKI